MIQSSQLCADPSVERICTIKYDYNIVVASSEFLAEFAEFLTLQVDNGNSAYFGSSFLIDSESFGS